MCVLSVCVCVCVCVRRECERGLRVIKLEARREVSQLIEREKKGSERGGGGAPVVPHWISSNYEHNSPVSVPESST